MQDLTFAPDIKDQSVLFRFWAPLHKNIVLKVDSFEPIEMQAAEDGWHYCDVVGAAKGSLYKFALPDGAEVPDPASRFQPQDVHGPSEVVDLGAYKWRMGNWTGRPWEEVVIYEVHVGSFSQEGSFLSTIERLDHLSDLGITAIQIMPIADFPGRFGWGYDGVLPYAVDSSYGRPEDLMALVDAAHERGICVYLDVVYNHFGPEGNYMPAYAPLFSAQHKTPWGNGVNYDAEHSKWVREFIIQNAIYWTTQFRLDGLRLDAVHAIKDDSEEHILHELARRVRTACAGRHIHLILENEDNNSDLLKRGENGEVELFTAQWNDDFHHVLHIAATGETFGYYADYANDPGKIGRALAEGFVFQGEHMPYRGGTRGKPSSDLSPTAFISFIHNHDQIGNRALGDRIIAAQPENVIKALAAIYLLSPQTPMLFMGEEWNAREPFPYFCDFNEELKQKVRDGRREELSRLPGFDSEDLPDPTTEATFASAKLNWSSIRDPSSAQMLDFYRMLLEMRQQRIVPLLKAAAHNSSVFQSSGRALLVDWTLNGGTQLHLRTNLSNEVVSIPRLQRPAEDQILTLGHAEHDTLAPWSVVWSSTKP